MNIALDPQRSVSVSASAGSGKTWQLVSRIVRLLLDGAEPGGILALTFTRKAAAEMRERVEARLRELAYADDRTLDALLQQIDLSPTDALRERARRLHETLLHAPFALRAQTLHVFCHELLSRFPLEAGVPAGYTLTENERELRDAAVSALMQRIRQQPDGPDARALAVWIASGASESTILGWLHGFIERRSDWWAYTHGCAGDAVADATDRLAAQLGIDPDDDRPPTAALDHPDIDRAITELHALLLAAAGVGRLKADMVAPALAAGGDARFAALRSALLTGDGSRRSLSQKKAISDSAWQSFLHAYGFLADQIDAIEAVRRRRDTWLRTAAGYRLGDRLLQALAAELQRTQQLTFADLEWRSYRLLTDSDQADWLRYKLDQRIDHLMLDEFQDTNPTQWQLLRPILDEMSAGNPERVRTAFIVGDAKQSIYGFRRANPELLGSAAQFLQQQLGGAPMPLNDSRRSAPAVIDFVNALFSGPDGEAIAFQPHGTHLKSDWGAVEVAPLVLADTPAAVAGDDAALRNPLTTPRPVAEDLRLQREADGVAARIKALVAARLPVSEHGRARPLDWGDVMILARQRTHLPAIEQALAAAGIPFIGASKGTLLGTLPVRDLMALLRFLDVPQRDLDLAQLLRSPLFEAGDADLMQLAAARDRGPHWWARLLALDGDGQASAALGRAAGLISRWQREARRLPAHDLLDRIACDTDLIRRYEDALPNDGRVRANVGAFLQLVLDADQGRYPTLGRLNQRLEQLADAARDAPSEAPPAASDGQVRVLTIHAAKGLEAPAVFLVNSAPAANHRHGGWQVEWPSDAATPSHFLLAANADDRDTLSAQLIDARRARESREALNLLYVAVTRARQYLFVSAFESSKAGPEPSWHERCLRAAQALPASAEPLPGAPAGVTAARQGRFPAVVDPPAAAAVATPEPRLRRPLRPAPTPIWTPSQSGEARDPDAVTRGRAIHWLLQQSANGRRPRSETLPAKLAAVLGEDIDASLVPGWQAEADAVLAAPPLSMLFDQTQLQRAWNEVPVQWQAADGSARHGVLDRLIDDGHWLTIIDYKTAPRPNAALLVDRYREQLAAYLDAIGTVFPGRPIRAGLLLTARCEWLPVLERC